MYLFDLLLILLLGSLFVSFIQGLFRGRRRNNRLSAEGDSLKETQEISREHAALTGMNTIQREQYHDSMTLSVCFARFALQVAYSDGHLDNTEVQSILAFFRGAHPSFSEHVRDVLEKDVNNPQTIDWDYNLQEARRVLAKSQWNEFSAIIFDGLLRISLADGVLNKREVETVFSIMGQLGWSRHRMESWFHTRAGFGSAFGEGPRNDHQETGQQWSASDSTRKFSEACDVLGVDPGADMEAIKKRYRELAREHHPDKYAHMGDEMQKTATKRFQVIQEAYDYISANRKK